MLKNTHAEPRNPSALESLGCASFLVMLAMAAWIALDAWTRMAK